MTDKAQQLKIAGDRVNELLRVLELMAAGDAHLRVKISDRHDELDAIAHGINVLVGEVAWSAARLREAQQVSERKRAEAAVVRESEARFRLIANTAPVMIWMSDVDKQVTYVNQPWLTFTGWPSDVVPGHRWIELIHSDDVERCGDVYVKAFDRREPFQVDHRLRRHDGEYRWIVTVGVPRYDTDGSFTGYVGTAADITERKLAEELLSTFSQRLIEAQEEERAHLARELHDDINQRLALLGVRLDHLNRGSVSPHELGQEIGKASQEVAKLAKDVQALSYRLHSSKLEVLGLAAAAAGLCRELSDGKAVEIDFHADSVPHHVPWRVSLCLFRVLQEALQNAIKHSGSRHFQVLLQGGVNEIDLAVRDSGIGFDSAETTTGRGLGLTSMKERLKLIDGHLSIDSKPGCGTTIRACAPVARNMKSPETGV